MTGPVIVLGVTSDVSFRLLHGQPAYLAERGWVVHVVSGGDSGDSPESRLGPSPRVTFHQVPMVREPAPLADLRSLVGWARLLRRLRPDVVCLGTPKASLVGLLAARMVGVPARIYLIRGLRYETEQGVRRALLLRLERLAAGCATHVVSVSASVRQVALDDGVARRTGIDVLGSGSSNGVVVPTDDEIGERRRRGLRALLALGLDPSRPVVGFVGRLTPDKGLHTLVEAFARLHRGGSEAQLLVLGANEAPAYARQVRHALAASGAPHAFAGHVSGPEDLTSVMDVLCLPSHREGLPNVCLEASAMGLPVVTTTATGNRDAVRDGSTGALFPAGDAIRLSEVLQAMLADPVGARAMGAAGRAWMRTDFARPEVWRRYDGYYRSASAGAGGARGDRGGWRHAVGTPSSAERP